MLQQTQVETVRKHYDRFLEAFPTLKDLAAADEQQVLKQWEGLGYYRRARSLHAGARRVVEEHNGKVPDDLEALLRLPGVGRYTAGAIRSIAFDRPAPILEANTVRLFSRLIAYRGDATSSEGQNRLWELAEALLPQRNASQFNQALMELGSLVCTPKKPDCPACPARDLCRAHLDGVVDRLGPTTKRIKATDLVEAAVVVHHRGRVLMRLCGDRERWSGMWDFPRFEIDSESASHLQKEITDKVSAQTGVRCKEPEQFHTLKHVVTRFKIRLECYRAQRTGGRVTHGAMWLTPEEVDERPLSVTARKIAKLIAK